MRYLALCLLAALAVGVVVALRNDWFGAPIPRGWLWAMCWSVVGLLWWHIGKASDWWRRRTDPTLHTR